MNIPESAIRPFEPHGIPKLTGDNNYKNLLDKEFLHLNLLGEDDDYCMNLNDLEVYIKTQLKHAGATSAYVNIDHSTQVLCVVNLLYTIPSSVRLQRYTEVVHVKGGFIRPMQ